LPNRLKINLYLKPSAVSLNLEGLLVSMARKKKNTSAVSKAPLASFEGEFFRKIIEHSSTLGYYCARANGTLTAANALFAAWLGFPSVTDLLEYSHLHGPFKKEADQKLFMRALEQHRELSQYACRWRCIDGAARTLYETAHLLPENEDQALSFCSIVEKDSLEDVVRERTQDLTRSNAYIKSILSTIPSALIVVNNKYEILTANGKFFSLFNLPVGNIIGRPFCEVIKCKKNDDPSCFIKERLNTVLGEGESFSTIENVICPGAGKSVNISIRIAALEDAEEKALMVFEDITQKKYFESKILQTERLAATGRLAASIAHEINNPLQGILTHLELIRQELPEKIQQDESFGIVMANILSIRDIVKQLLDIYRGAHATKSRIDINSVIERVAHLVQNQVSLKRAVLSLKLAPDVPLLFAWEQQIHQVILNIVLNALDAIADEGRISVKTFMCGDDILIKIKDNGNGIDPEQINDIFDPFFSTKKDSPGVGLGLFVCQGLVKNHNGIISVSSRSGAGTEFSITLPVTQ
jgi:signal transduction histidine kinase